MNLPWDWYQISFKPNISLKDIKNNKKLPWNWNALSNNPNITLDFVKKNLKKNWEWKTLSDHPNITVDDILSNPELDWEWMNVARNPNVNTKNISQLYYYIDELDDLNPNLTMKYIEDNIDHISWGDLSNNTFKYKKRLAGRVVDTAMVFKGLPVSSGRIPTLALENILNHAYNTRGTLGFVETYQIIRPIMEN